MSKSQRDKGLRAENEIRLLFATAGLGIVGLDRQGDHIVACGELRLHVETKRREVVKILEWSRQAEREAIPGSIPIVPYRTNREPWRVSLRLDDLIRILLHGLQQPAEVLGWDGEPIPPESSATSAQSLTAPPPESPAGAPEIT